MLYLVAGLTGFRRGELLSMRWSDVILNENNPVILLDGSRTKNHRDVVQPIPNGLCRMLFCWKQTLNPGPDEPLFHNFTEHGRPSEWIREDLKAANLPTKDYEGRKIDFHSLRGSYITFLANSQTPVRVTQELARHSNPALTMNVYAKVLPEIQKQAVRSLPIINLASCFAMTLVKNGGLDCSGIDYSGQKTDVQSEMKKEDNDLVNKKLREMGRGGIEPPTHGFSVRCSTD